MSQCTLGEILLLPLTHPSLLLKELLQLLLLTGQLQLHVLTARQEALIVLQCREKTGWYERDGDV